MADINLGQLTEAINDKADRDLNNLTIGIDYVIDYKKPTESDPTWYRVYKSGWCEQGGYYSSSDQNYKTYNVSLLKKMANGLYFVSVHQGRSPDANMYATNIQNRTKSGFSMSYIVDTAGVSWKVEGQLEEGEY